MLVIVMFVEVGFEFEVIGVVLEGCDGEFDGIWVYLFG